MPHAKNKSNFQIVAWSLPEISCLTILLTKEEKITKIMDSGDTVDLVFRDLTKTFVSANHRFLVNKLKTYGTNNNVLSLLQQFFTERLFNVSLNGTVPHSEVAVGGVPRGSVLGPFLFLIYINDLQALFQGDEFLFAVDVKLIFAKISFNDLQQDLDLGRWPRTIL